MVKVFYLIKYGLSLPGCIMSPKKGFKNLFSMTNFLDSTRFTLFMSLFNAIYKISLCTMRRQVKTSDKINAPIAGIISALMLIIEAKSRWKTISL